MLNLSGGRSARADKDVLVGIIAGGTVETSTIGTGDERCQMPGYPGVLTKVSFYADWIDSNVRKHSRYHKSKKSHKHSRKGNRLGGTRN